MPITGKQRAGKNARIKVQGTPLNYGDYDCDDKADDLDETNFESGGLEQGTIGIEVVEYTAGGFFDAGAMPYDDPPGLFPRDNLPNMLVYPSVTDGTFWNFPLARVFTAKNSANVRAMVLFTWGGKSQGPFSRPTGSH